MLYIILCVRYITTSNIYYIINYVLYNKHILVYLTYTINYIL